VGEEQVGEEQVGEEQVGEEQVGEGVVVIPQDPNALVGMLSLRMASFQAGNTGVRNEIVSICDELLRQGTMNTEQYKNLTLSLPGIFAVSGTPMCQAWKRIISVIECLYIVTSSLHNVNISCAQH
jgi:hypothetical protein